MSSCLGLFVEDNLIKYAKVSKENDNIKIENYGIKFYEQELDKTISQIVDETFSYKVPISMNISNEKYTNLEIFGLLGDNDEKKCIKTEFEYFCNETGKNKLTLDYKTIISQSIKDPDKKNVLYAFTEKGNIAEKIQLLDSYRVASLSPVAMSIQNLPKEEIQNSLIINIENRTEITTNVRGVPVKVDIIEHGMKEILNAIAEKENSVSKAYEICKNTTLYTESSQNLQTESNDYIEIIVPSIYKIIEETQKIINKNEIEIEKIYITGSGATINNIDLYFQENFLDYKCEILAPYFIDKTNIKLNIKDYIEVNSAIALALQSMDKRTKDINFISTSFSWSKAKELLTSDVHIGGKSTQKGKSSKITTLNIQEINCIRFAYGVLCILIIYITITLFLNGRINQRLGETQEVIEDTKTKTSVVANYNSLVQTRTKNYQTILEQLDEANRQASEVSKSKNAIPNLLSEIMFAIPKEAQILSIENTEEKHIIIKAQANEYPYLGYLKSEIQNRAILINVTSTSGTREANDMIQVTIEGDLPY